MNWLSELGKFIQQTAKTWLALFLASGFLWLFPELLPVGNLSDKADSYLSAAVRLIFILSACFLISNYLFYMRDGYRDRLKKNAKFEVLKGLTPPERKLLGRYLEAETKALELDAGESTVISLKSQDILTQPVNLSIGGMIGGGRMPLPTIVIQTWAYDYLKRHPELIA